MAASAEPLLLTVEHLHALPERKDVLEELHWGRVVIFSRPKPWHVKLQMRLGELLRPLAGDRGHVITELPFRAVPEYDLRAADVAFVEKHRWDQVGDGDLIGPPELVIEVLSPSSTKNQIREYAALCLANGSEEFWLVERSTQTVTITDRQGQSNVYHAGEVIPIRALGGKTVAVKEIFG
jgi:Uma2 family endonuclease